MSHRRAVAEALGTFVLVFGGVGSAVIAGPAIGALGVAFAFGLSLLAMAYAIGPISGCHINPAVTLGLLHARRITLDEAVRYWIAQVAGAIVAAGVLVIVAKSRAGGYDLSDKGFGANGLGQLWLFIVAPLLGAVGGSALHQYLFAGSTPIDPEESAVLA